MKKKKIMAELCATIDELRGERNNIAKENLRLESGLADLQRKINELKEANVKLSIKRGQNISLNTKLIVKSLVSNVVDCSVYMSQENSYVVNELIIPAETFIELKKLLNK